MTRPNVSPGEPTLILPRTRVGESLHAWVMAQPGDSVAAKVRGVLLLTRSPRSGDCELCRRFRAGCAEGRWMVQSAHACVDGNSHADPVVFRQMQAAEADLSTLRLRAILSASGRP